MPYPTDVKIFWCDPGMTSIGPFVGGTTGRGSMTAVLDACLVNGYGLKTADSVVVSGGIATVNISTGHEYGKWQVVLVAGATPSGLNGEKRVLSVTANTLTFDATGIADGTATGTITTKIAPLGWLKPFSGTNKAVYKIDTVKYPEASNTHLRVDDSAYTYVAGFTLYESMTGVDTGTDRVPTVGQSSFGYSMLRSSSASALSTYWVLIGDGRCFYLMTHWSQPTTTGIPEYGANVNFFGEAISPDAADPYNFFIQANYSSDSSPNMFGTDSALYHGSPGQFRRVRAANRITKSVGVTTRVAICTSANSGLDSTSSFPFPNISGGGIQLTQSHLTESQDQSYVGKLPGAYFVNNRVGNKMHASRLERIYDSNSSSFPNRVIAYLLTAYSTSTPGVTAFDIIGPWR